MNKSSAAIIGGGIAGLTTAYKLKEYGWDVKLFESSNRLGGSVQTFESDGYLAELGPNTILETSPKVTELLTELGLDDEKIYSDGKARKRYIVKNGKPVPLPLSPPAFIASQLFNLRAKIQLFREIFIPPWSNEYEESLAHFVKRRLGQEFLDYLQQ